MLFRARYVLVVLALVAGAIYAGFSVVIFNRSTLVQAACAVSVTDMRNTPSDFQRENFDTTPYQMDSFEDVRFTSRDDQLQLTGWFIPAPADSAPAIIIVHGHNGCKQSAPVLTAAGMLHRNGFSVLAIDLREHGSSQIDDERTLGGLDEYRDVLGAWDWLQQAQRIPPQRIGLMGFSLGAASVVIAAGAEPGVVAVWEDSSFASVNQIINSELARNHYPPIFAPATSVVSRLLTGTDILSYGPVDALRHLNGRPYFVVHGSADARVSVDQAEQIAAAVRANDGQVETWIVPGAGHTGSIFLMPDAYETRLVAFFSTALTADEQETVHLRPQ